MLFLNITRGVQARSINQDIAETGTRPTASAGNDHDHLPVFTHPKPRVAADVLEKNNFSLKSSTSSELSSAANNNDTRQLSRISCQTSVDLAVANGISCSLEAGTYPYNSITVQTTGTLILTSNPITTQGMPWNVGTLTTDVVLSNWLQMSFDLLS